MRSGPIFVSAISLHRVANSDRSRRRQSRLSDNALLGSHADCGGDGRAGFNHVVLLDVNSAAGDIASWHWNRRRLGRSRGAHLSRASPLANWSPGACIRVIGVCAGLLDKRQRGFALERHHDGAPSARCEFLGGELSCCGQQVQRTLDGSWT